MKRLLLLVAFGMVLLSAEHTKATETPTPLTGSSNLNYCREWTNNSAHPLATQCAGVVIGTLGSVNYYKAAFEIKLRNQGTSNSIPNIFCVPPGVTNLQHVRVVVSYLERHPQEQHNHLSLLTILAHMEAFPCTPQQQRR